MSGSSGDLDDAWPLFQLRLRLEDVELRVPRDDDVAQLLQVARRGIHDREIMPFSMPWTDAQGAQFDRGFAQFFWGTRAGWREDDWHLVMAVRAGDTVVGVQELAAKNFRVLGLVETGSWLGREFQGRGIGTRMRAAVLGLAFEHLGARAARSAAFDFNESSIRVSRRLGYAENGWGLEAPRGQPQRQLRFIMDAQAWGAQPRPRVHVEGLQACRDMFGLRQR